MSSPFQQAALAASTAVDAIYGERVRIDPMRPGRYTGPAADPDRASRVVTAALSIRAHRIRMSDDKFGRDFNTQFAGALITFTVARSELDGLDVRPGDRMVRLDHGDETFEISVMSPCGMVRTLFDLVQVKE
jgi:hypothetical protein